MVAEISNGHHVPLILQFLNSPSQTLSLSSMICECTEIHPCFFVNFREREREVKYFVKFWKVGQVSMIADLSDKLRFCWYICIFSFAFNLFAQTWTDSTLFQDYVLDFHWAKLCNFIKKRKLKLMEIKV